MKKSVFVKVLASLLVITLTFANLLILQSFAQEVYAATKENVSFEAYLKDEEGKNYSELTSSINEQLFLCLDVSVSEGYLDNAEISLGDSNLKLKATEKISQISDIDIENGIVYLNQIGKGQTINVQIPVEFKYQENYSVEDLTKTTNVVLEGNYISEEGKTSNLKLSEKVKLSIETKSDVQISQDITKVVTFGQDKKSLLVETVVRANIQNNEAPVKNTTLDITVPSINGKKPTEVLVHANSLKATNGDNGESFTVDNYKYENNTIQISVDNIENEEGIISWNKNAQDEYVITYIYAEENVPATKILQTVNATITTYTNQELKQDGAKAEFEITENKGKLVSTQIGLTSAKINKGYLYSKSEQETNFDVYYIVDIAYSKEIDEIIINANQEKLLNQDKEEIAIENQTHFNKTVISVSNFEKILGEQGEITITDNNGKEIAKINKETEIQDDKYVVNYEEEVKNIVIKTTKPVAEGKLQIENTKTLKLDNEASKEQIQEIKSMKFAVETVANKKVEKTVEKTTKTPNSEEKAMNVAHINLTPADNISITDSTTVTITNGVGNVVTTYSETTNGVTTTNTTVENIDATNQVTIINGTVNTTSNENSTGTNTQTTQTETITENVNVNTDTVEIEIETVEPTTQISTNIYNNTLTTVQTNKNLQFNITLKTNEATCELFENPTITIELPSYISSIEANANMINNNGLKFKDLDIKTAANGNKIIEITIEGTQTSNTINSAIEGALVTVIADLDLTKDAITKQDVAKISVTNKGTTVTEEQPLNIVAPTGLVTLTTIDINGNQETSISGQEGAGKIDVNSGATNATIKLTAINNYQNKLQNIQILGRIPFAGNKEITSNKDLGSTFTANLSAKISQVTQIPEENIEIYYSENGEADNDLTKTSNGWTKEPTDLSKVKSYTIVLKNYTMNQGDKIEFKYDVQIPENLNHDQAAYSTFVVYFDNVSTEQTIRDVQESTKVGAVTTQGPELEIAITSNVMGQKVQEGQIIKYTVSVLNKGSQEAKYLNIKGFVPVGTTYVEQNENGKYEEKAGTPYASFLQRKLEAGKTCSFDYEVKVDSKEYEGQKIQTSATVLANDMDATLKSESISNEVIEGYLNIEIYTRDTEISAGKEISYKATIKNVNSNNERTNVVAKLKVPDGLTYKSDNLNGSYDQKTNTVTWNIGTIGILGEKSITIIFDVNDLESGKYEKEIKTTVTATCSETQETATSNESKLTVKKAGLRISQVSDITAEKVSPGDYINYNLTVTNIGKTEAKFVQIKDYLPEGLQFIKGEYKTNSTSYPVVSEDDSFMVELATLEVDKTVEITIRAKVKNVDNNTELVNIVKASADGVSEVEANQIKHIVDSSANGTNGGGSNGNNNPSATGAYKISGTVWNDTNMDGKRDSEEATIDNVEVILLDKTGIMVATQKTSNGMYNFTGLENGEYQVIFMFDNTMYTVTTYKKASIEESRNSDAMLIDVKMNDEIKKGAATDKIVLNNENIYNIDLGLINANKFDLKLSKTVSKVTVQTSKETKEYNYSGDKLVKIDINPNNVKGANVIIEYKISVTNEGAVPGYVKKIVDYVPSDLKFISDLNADWYLAENGSAYNSTFANTVINPGETKEVTITLTKTMTEENLGLIRNIAEIYECYNDLGIEDIDSKPANSKQGEDDMQSADVVLSLNTGEGAVYATITIAMIAVFATGAYIIKKKVLNRI